MYQVESSGKVLFHLTRMLITHGDGIVSSCMLRMQGKPCVFFDAMLSALRIDVLFMQQARDMQLCNSQHCDPRTASYTDSIPD